ncbi:hypothetical protein F4779DRAFT_586082 [Xylariaceae sp. FL0662B]|nr:hypothetical protein F4779DRAFT_586082 [Xylariaceae sp. FL0662B]
MPYHTVLRGFKVPISVLDAFLSANGVGETSGYPPFDSSDPASDLLRAKTGHPKTRLFIPHKKAYNNAAFAYVAYDWVMVFAQREIRLGEELSDEAPESFSRLRQDIMSFAAGAGQEVPADDGMAGGLFVVITEERSFIPPELRQREKTPVTCDQCNETFADWHLRQTHRMDVHGSIEGLNPLPDA